MVGAIVRPRQDVVMPIINIRVPVMHNDHDQMVVSLSGVTAAVIFARDIVAIDLVRRGQTLRLAP